MTDITKALAFSKECLQWTERKLNLNQLEDVFFEIERFLGKRFFIQINRGTTSLFKWSVMVGLQDRAGGPTVYSNGQADSDDMLDAIFDACVSAARLYPNT